MNGETARNAFAPLLVLSLALLLWFGFQCVALVDENQRLGAVHEKQEPLLQNARKLRETLDTLTHQTAKLADQGNRNARLIVDELKKRGVSTDPHPPQPPQSSGK